MEKIKVNSESVNELAAALAKAQIAFKPIKKNRVAKIASAKGSYEYNYADLADVIEATVGALSANGLSISQPVTLGEATGSVTTRLLHASGQFLSSECQFFLGDRMQETGARITYLRRYALSGMLGVASEDDTDLIDSATDTKKGFAKPSGAVMPRKTIVADPGASTGHAPVVTPAAIIPKTTPNEEHTRLLFVEAAKKSGWSLESVTHYLDVIYGVKMVRDLTPEQAKFVLGIINTKTTVQAFAEIHKTTGMFSELSPDRIK